MKAQAVFESMVTTQFVHRETQHSSVSRAGEGNSTSAFPCLWGLHLGCSGLSRRRLLADGKENCSCKHDSEACQENDLVLDYPI
jgi:hypothetical protein